MKETPNWLKNGTFPIILTSIVAILELLKNEIGLPFLENDHFSKAFFPIFILGIVWLIYTAVVAYNSFGTNKKTFGPFGFWRLLFHKIPTNIESNQINSVDILIIFDSDDKESLSIVDQIKQEYESQKINLNFLIYQGQGSLDKNLFNREDPLDGIYLIYNRNLYENKFVIKDIENWANKNEDKPIIYADLADASNDLTFGRVSRNEAVSGLWRLLLRSSQRANLWKEQSFIYRKYFFGFIILSLVIFSILLLQRSRALKISQHSESKIEQILDLDNSIYWQYRANIENFKTQFNLQVNLDSTNYQYAKNLLLSHLKSLLNTHGITEKIEEEWKLSLWKKDNKNCIYEIAWSKNDERTCFKMNNNSIIGEAFLQPKKFILWKQKFLHDEPSVWLVKDNQVVCRYNAQKEKHESNDLDYEFNIQLQPIDGEKHLAGEKDRKALLCLAIHFPELNQTYGISIDTYTKSDIEFFSSPLFRKQLLEVLPFAIFINFEPDMNNPDCIDCECDEQKKTN